ncbi:MAG: hypothetical protein R3E84_12765 [Pseudomonadales bacterium]
MSPSNTSNAIPRSASGTDQGKLGNINGVALLAEALGKSIAEAGTTMFRPAYAGRLPVHLPVATWARCSIPSESLHSTTGTWNRKRYSGVRGSGSAPGTTPGPVNRWMMPAHREGVAAVQARRGSLLDASTLGKIDVWGPDAGEFLDRIYTNRLSNLGIGRCRYAMLLKEDGMVFDDGVVARIQARTATWRLHDGRAACSDGWNCKRRPSGRICRGLAHLGDGSVGDHRDHRSDSRPVLSDSADTALDRDALPFMTWRSGTVAGVSARVMRISFTGELGEINVRPGRHQTVWEACYRKRA